MKPLLRPHPLPVLHRQWYHMSHHHRPLVVQGSPALFDFRLLDSVDPDLFVDSATLL